MRLILGGFLGRRAEEDRRGAKTLREAFQTLGDGGARWQILQEKQRRQEAELKREQAKLEEAARKEQAVLLTQEQARQRQQFTGERSSLILKHAMENVKPKAEWQQLGQERRQALSQSCKNEPSSPGQENSKSRADDKSKQNPNSLAAEPPFVSEEEAIKEYIQKMKEKQERAKLRRKPSNGPKP